MIVENIQEKQVSTPVKVMDCFVGDGFRQGDGGSMPDVDCDFQSDRRQEVKEYLERRYNLNGRQRVFSAGTYSTMKLKAVLKDVCRVYKVNVSLVNYITAIFEDDNMTWTDLFKLAATNKKVNKFIQDYPEAIEDIRSIMGQPRSASVHASAIIVTPDTNDGKDMECFDYTPIKKVDDILVSELDGYSIDDTGLLKNDCLGIKELSKIQAVIDECNRIYHPDISFEKLVRSGLDDKKTYELFAKGFSQNIFQFSSKGMTKFLMDLKPDNINDLIAANALYRPATLESGSLEKYLDCKRGDVAPVYLWGTYNALHTTFGQLVYQENLAQMAREVGGFSLGEGVNLVKYISKKKTDKIHAMKDKFMEGASKNGCPNEDAVKIWEMVESGGSYLFNKCISGKESIYRIHGGRWKPTIGEMYRIMHDKEYAAMTGHIHLHDKYRHKGYGIAFSLNEHKRLVKNWIVDIRYMGKRPLYRITLEDGKTLDVTGNHTHPVFRGKKRTDELVAGKDRMYVNIGHIKQDTSYRFTNKGEINNIWYHNNEKVTDYTLNSTKGQMGFIHNPDSEYTRLEYYRKNLMADHCEQCGSLNNRLEIHHVNGHHGECGENFNNLQTLCPSCHKKEHYRMGRVKMGERGLGTALRTVQSVEYIGDEEVYDIEMEAPYHTFVTCNGVVTCNSHATAYSITAYVGAWLKANYPTAFYTVALQWADDKEIPAIMSEMEQCSTAKIVPPDVNVSGIKFFTDYETDEIFWSLSRIKMLGGKSVEYIIAEREKNGPFTSIENFIYRIFKYKLKKYQYWDDPDNEQEATRVPVNALHIRNLIMTGCFDRIENVKAVVERYSLLERAAKELGFKLSDTDFPADLTDKHYFWQMQQVAISGIGSVDYRRIYDNSDAKDKIRGKASYMSLRDALSPDNEGKRIAVCATVAELSEVSYKDKTTGEKKKFCKMKLQQNNDLMELVIWNDFYIAHKSEISNLKDKMIITTCIVKYSEYAGANSLQNYKTSLLFNV